MLSNVKFEIGYTIHSDHSIETKGVLLHNTKKRKKNQFINFEVDFKYFIGSIGS